jgi:hypothetical protein
MMVTFPSTTNSLASVITAGVMSAKSIVVPLVASASAWRSDPAPLSAVVVTSGSRPRR